MVDIKIDQVPLAAGVPGVAREDLATGTPVTLTAIGGPYFRYQWQIINKPLNLDTGLRSAAALATPTALSTLLSPIDVPGTYLIELLVDSGSGLGASSTDVKRITFYAGPTLATVPGRLPGREPAVGETTEHNVGGNAEGWGATLRRWFRVIVDLFAVRSWAQAVISFDGVTASVMKGANVAGVLYDVGVTDGFILTFSSAFPDTTYGTLCTAVYDGGVTIPHVLGQTTTDVTIVFLDALGNAVPVSQFAVDVILR